MQAPVTEFLRKKWRQAFHFFDADNDGVLTADNYAAIGDYISQKTGATKEEADHSRHEWVKWFEYLQLEQVEVVDELRYESACEHLYQHKEQAKQLSVDSAGYIFDCLDSNKDGKLSLTELTVFYEAVGAVNRFIIRDNFSKMDKDGDGFISREDFIHEIVRHYMDPDLKTGQTYLMAYAGH